MTPQIITKLQKEISTGLETEVQVVYVLAEIRKIIEQDNLEDDYKYLVFHCNWALHSKMNRAMAQEVLSHFDVAHAALVASAEFRSLPTGLQRKLEDITGMNRFEEELSSFLQNYQLTDFTAGLDGWSHFLHLYAGVIEDCPLVIRADNNAANVTKVTVYLEKAADRVLGEQYYKITWKVMDRAGQSCEIPVINSFSQ